MLPDSIRRDSMADRVKEVLFRRILSGELAPGARLVELQIAREMNTSQGPVREALRELEALELVVTEPYKGSRVRQVSDRDTLEAYQTRGALEQLSGQLAAVYLKGRTAALKKEAEAIRVAARRNHAEDYAIHDMNFHRMIVEESRNRILLRTWDSLSFEIRIRLWLAQGRVDLNAAEADHWPIIDALEVGDGEKAGRLLRQHLLFAIADVKLDESLREETLAVSG